MVDMRPTNTSAIANISLAFSRPGAGLVVEEGCNRRSGREVMSFDQRKGLASVLEKSLGFFEILE